MSSRRCGSTSKTGSSVLTGEFDTLFRQVQHLAWACRHTRIILYLSVQWLNMDKALTIWKYLGWTPSWILHNCWIVGAIFITRVPHSVSCVHEYLFQAGVKGMHFSHFMYKIVINADRESSCKLIWVKVVVEGDFKSNNLISVISLL